MSCVQCLLCFTSSVGCKNKVLRKFAFFPPSPPSYSITSSEGVLSLSLSLMPAEGIEPEVHILHKSEKESIPSLYLKNSRAMFTILFSHGNATDIGYMGEYMMDLAVQLGVSILIYEYTGYGPTAGKPSEVKMYADIEAAYKFLIEKGVPWHSIVLYGQSIGSGPSCHLASKEKVGGLILHSPVASGLFLVDRKYKRRKFDLFDNLGKMPYIRCPVFLIHGTSDRAVPIKNAYRLAELIRFTWTPWWVINAGHNDIETMFKTQFLSNLRHFLDSLLSFIIHAGNDSELEALIKPFDLNIPVYSLPPGTARLKFS